MKRKLYDWFVPQSLRQKLYNMHIREFLTAEEQKKRKFAESQIPNELSSGYIKNLKVVPDRIDLLRMLPENGVAVEIGATLWEFTNQLLIITHPRKLHLIRNFGDKGEMEIWFRQFNPEFQTSQVKIEIGESVVEIEKLSDKSFDWVYVNSDQSYLNTFELLNLCDRKLKEAGLIAGASYSLGNWINSERFGVIQAVNEFCKIRGWELICLTNESDRNLTYLLRRLNSK